MPSSERRRPQGPKFSPSLSATSLTIISCAAESGSHDEITMNAVALCKLAAAYDIPAILFTVAVDMGVNEETIPQIRDVLPDAASD